MAGRFAVGAARQVGKILGARAGVGGLLNDETHFLNALQETIADGRSPADELLAKYHGEWGGDLSRIYDEYSY